MTLIRPWIPRGLADLSSVESFKPEMTLIRPWIVDESLLGTGRFDRAESRRLRYFPVCFAGLFPIDLTKDSRYWRQLRASGRRIDTFFTSWTMDSGVD